MATRADPHDDEWDRLAAALNRYGIRHVAPLKRPSDDVTEEPVELFLQLARASEVRLREASILLLLTHPTLAPAALEAIRRLAGEQRAGAIRRYVATSALQRMWRTRIELTLGPPPLIPPAYMEELGLPSLDEDYGRATLWALSSDEEVRYEYDAWAGYTSLMDLFLGEIELNGWGVAPSPPPSPVESEGKGKPAPASPAGPAPRARAG